jgi:hypothetical protein
VNGSAAHRAQVANFTRQLLGKADDLGVAGPQHRIESIRRRYAECIGVGEAAARLDLCGHHDEIPVGVENLHVSAQNRDALLSSGRTGGAYLRVENLTQVDRTSRPLAIAEDGFDLCRGWPLVVQEGDQRPRIEYYVQRDLRPVRSLSRRSSRARSSRLSASSAPVEKPGTSAKVPRRDLIRSRRAPGSSITRRTRTAFPSGSKVTSSPGSIPISSRIAFGMTTWPLMPTLWVIPGV